MNLSKFNITYQDFLETKYLKCILNVIFILVYSVIGTFSDTKKAKNNEVKLYKVVNFYVLLIIKMSNLSVRRVAEVLDTLKLISYLLSFHCYCFEKLSRSLCHLFKRSGKF